MNIYRFIIKRIARLIESFVLYFYCGLVVLKIEKINAIFKKYNLMVLVRLITFSFIVTLSKELSTH